MEIKKQVPSITVTIRVPTHIHELMEEQLLEMKKRGLKVSKNSLFVEALTQFLDKTEEEQVDQDEEVRWTPLSRHKFFKFKQWSLLSF